MAAAREVGDAPPPSCTAGGASSKLQDFDFDRDEQEMKDLLAPFGIDFDKIPLADDDDDDDFESALARLVEITGTPPLPLSPPALNNQVLFNGNDTAHGACAPTSPSTDPSKCALVHDSPTSVAFFGDSEAEQTPALSELSNSAHPKLLGLAFPSVSDSSPACEVLTMPFSTFKTPISTCDVSSTYEKGSDTLCFSCAQDILLNSLSTAAFSSDLPCILVAPTFFAYWFDGFLPSQFLCALFIIFVLFIEPFDDIVPKLGLSKYLKESIYSLDLASMTAGPRATKSYTTILKKSSF